MFFFFEVDVAGPAQNGAEIRLRLAREKFDFFSFPWHHMRNLHVKPSSQQRHCCVTRHRHVDPAIANVASGAWRLCHYYSLLRSALSSVTKAETTQLPKRPKASLAPQPSLLASPLRSSSSLPPPPFLSIEKKGA